MSRAACILVSCLSLWVADPVKAQPAPAPLAQAWQAFQRGQTDEVTGQVQALLPGLNRPRDLRDAHLLLGLCAHLRGDQQRATDQLISALSYDPGYQGDPLLLAPDLLQLLRAVARDHGAEIKARAARHPAPGPTTRPAETPSIEAAAPGHQAKSPLTLPAVDSPAPGSPPLYLALIPFGVGQFANGHRTKAFSLLFAESGLVVTSLTCLFTAISLQDSRGQYQPDVIDTARALNAVYLVSAYAAGALMIYGLVDGLYYRRRPAQQRSSSWLFFGAPLAGQGVGPHFSLTHHF